jgi:hypothetical protein
MVTLKGESIVPEFLAILESYVANRYATVAVHATPPGVGEPALPR